jgi:hypothetical protein
LGQIMRIIGLSAVARAGKDSVCTILNREFAKLGYHSQRFALADELKNDMYDFIYDNFGIDIWNCTDEQKVLVRPLMVAYGGAKRKQSKGKYWTDLLYSENLKGLSKDDIAIIPDIRYAEYVDDEVDWVKNLGGLVVHITRMVNGSPLPPPNEDEKINDPKVKARADIHLEWSSFSESSQETEEAKVIHLFNQIREKWNL